MSVPLKIVINNEDQYLEIIWSDGPVYTYPLYGLRKNCPCVMCRGGHDKMQLFEPEAFNLTPKVGISIHKADQIGNHALQIHWSDGHNSGMYRWQTLREIYDEWQAL
jgi:DUF971 family protein